MQPAGAVDRRRHRHAVVLLQDAADPDVGRELVLGQADRPADEVGRLADPAARTDVDAAVPEHPRREGGYGHERRFRLLQAHHVARQRQFRGVELGVADHAVEDLLHLQADAGQGHSFDTDRAVPQALGPVALRARQAQLQGQLSSSGRADAVRKNPVIVQYSSQNGLCGSLMCVMLARAARRSQSRSREHHASCPCLSLRAARHIVRSAAPGEWPAGTPGPPPG
jgi:hypothetical protein